MPRRRTGLRRFNKKIYTYKKTCFSDGCVEKLKRTYKKVGYSVRTVRNSDGSVDVYYRQ